MKSAILGAVLLVVGGVLVATGILPLADAAAVGDRVWPILLFVIAITVVTELAAEAELFRVVAERAARWGGGRAWVLCDDAVCCVFRCCRGSSCCWHPDCFS